MAQRPVVRDVGSVVRQPIHFVRVVRVCCLEAASFEPARFAISGRGERRMEFRGLPRNATIRIFTVRGTLVRTLRHDGSDAGYVAWDLRTKDNLDVAPGLYVYHVEAPGMGTHVGKFGVIK